MSSQALCVKLSLSYLVLSVSIELLRNGEQAFSMCVHPCPRYLTLESAGCEHCDVLPSRTLRSRLAFFHNEGAQARVPRGSGPAAAEAQRRLRSWGSQIDLSAELETDTALSLFTWQVQCLLAGLRSTRCGFFRPDRGTDTLYDSEELDVVSVKSMHEILRIRHLSLVLMRSLLRM